MTRKYQLYCRTTSLLPLVCENRRGIFGISGCVRAGPWEEHDGAFRVTFRIDSGGGIFGIVKRGCGCQPRARTTGRTAGGN